MSVMPQAGALPPPPPLSRDHALFLDVDGCLVEFADRPDGVHVSTDLRAALHRVQGQLGGALALVSGRTLADLDTLFAPLDLHAAGHHGVERRGAQGVAHARMAATRDAAFDDVMRDAEALMQHHAGARLEHKPLGFALHWRMAPRAADDLMAFAEHAVTRLPAFALQPGDHVVEIKPRGVGKGDAIDAFLREAPFTGRRPVFLGDDLTDEHGFAAVNARGGTSVVVGPRRPTVARHALADPAAVSRWLFDFLSCQDTP